MDRMLVTVVSPTIMPSHAADHEQTETQDSGDNEY
jgi:hypothetical protein